MKTCYKYSLEAPLHHASYEDPQHMFSWRNKKKYFPDTPSYLEDMFKTVLQTRQTLI